MSPPRFTAAEAAWLKVLFRGSAEPSQVGPNRDFVAEPSQDFVANAVQDFVAKPNQDFVDHLDPDFLARLRWHGIVGLVHAVAPGHPELRAEAAAIAARNALRMVEAARVTAALAAAGIHPVGLKGLALLGTAYEHPGLRPMADIDLLVDGGALEGADHVMASLGYGRAVTEAPDIVHHWAYRLRGPDDLPDSVEIHRRLFDAPPHSTLVSTAAVLDRSVPGVGHPVGHLRLPCASDMVLHLAGHTTLQHAGSERLIWIADVDRAIRVALTTDSPEHSLDSPAHSPHSPEPDPHSPEPDPHSPEPDPHSPQPDPHSPQPDSGAQQGEFWDTLWDRALTWDLAPALAECLACANRWFGTPVEIRSSDQAARERYQSARSRAPVGMEGARLAHDLTASSSWRQRALMARRAVLPSPDFMRRWYGVRGARDLSIAYARRWVSGTADILHARRATGPGTEPSDRWFVVNDPGPMPRQGRSTRP